MSDTLSAILAVLNISSTRRTMLEASGTWALAYPALDRIKFVAVLRGSCWLVAGNQSPRQLGTGDVALIGRTGYIVADDPATPPVDGRQFYTNGREHLRIGGSDTVLIGGGVAFARGTADFMLDMLPAFLIVERASGSASAVSAILDMLDLEAHHARPGSEAVNARLAELLVIEAIRFQILTAGKDQTGWLAALADLRLGRALSAFHADVARPWTVAQLAEIAGMSRAAFAAAFASMSGYAPNAYLRAWRLTLARKRLLSGASIAATAAEVGYTSQSAFSQAYRRTFGTSPGSERRRSLG